MGDVIKINKKGEEDPLEFYHCHSCGCQTKFGFMHEPWDERLIIRHVICQCGATITLHYNED